jgi:hypothetical protein
VLQLCVSFYVSESWVCRAEVVLVRVWLVEGVRLAELGLRLCRSLFVVVGDDVVRIFLWLRFWFCWVLVCSRVGL